MMEGKQGQSDRKTAKKSAKKPVSSGFLMKDLVKKS